MENKTELPAQWPSVTASECHWQNLKSRLTDWLTGWLNDWLSTWSRILLEKLLVPQNQEISCILRNLKVHYHVHNSPPLFLILMQMNLNHILPPYFFTVYFNIIVLSMSRSSKCSLSCRFPYQNSTIISLLPHVFHLLCPSHSPWLITLIFGDEYKLWSSSMCNFLQ